MKVTGASASLRLHLPEKEGLPSCVSTTPASLSALAHQFLGKEVEIRTHVGTIKGVLVKIGKSVHGGFGALILETDTWCIVKEWVAIVR